MDDDWILIAVIGGILGTVCYIATLAFLATVGYHP